MRPVGISIGDFNFRVTFYTQSEGSVDAYGNPTLSLGDGVERWANVKAKQKSYVQDNGGIEYQTEFEITVRKPLTIEQGDRVDFDGQQLQIVGVDDSDKTVYKLKAIGIK